MIGGIAQRLGRLGLAHDAHQRAALAQLAAQVGEVRVAGHQAEHFDPLVEQQLHGIQRQGDIGGVLAAGVLVLQARSERLFDQLVAPLPAQGAGVSVAATHHDAAKLRAEPERGFDDLGLHVVAVHQDRDACFITALTHGNPPASHQRPSYVGRLP